MEQSKAPTAQKARALEAYLVTSARMGDTAAMDQLVRLVQPRLLRHANRLLHDAEGARDVTQTAWVDILRGLPRLREVAAFRAFAMQIVTRKVAAAIRIHQRDRELATGWAEEAEFTIAPLGERTTDAQHVRDAIAKLPPTHQATLALFYLDEMTVAEVATALDVPIGTVKTRLMHAREKLRVLFKGDTNDQTG
ncbi:RNA polymerase sigma factor [Loktanella sp. Alg231-35]|uniref:RNA polymerase sigma factor n=1 Tax=Loktanella sp. Alg231-35 TaxID=1922220 RepID=UPI000D55436F|nr:sigma-70 family RNA polymerase sigma factor [Loktanella sp. Alg231-35]